MNPACFVQTRSGPDIFLQANSTDFENYEIDVNINHGNDS
jgi:hypothetical protein